MRGALLLALFLAPHLAHAQAGGTWTLLPSSPEAPGRWDDASFVDPQTGWIVNTSGQVYGTADGGDTWDALATLTQGNGLAVKLRTVVFVSPEHGFSGTLSPGHVLYETLDGGHTWTEISDSITGPLPEGICGMWAVDDQHLYAAGAYFGAPTFLKSTDGGQTWASQDMSAYADALVDVYFWDADRGIVVGGAIGPSAYNGAVVLMTEDGGATWTNRYTGDLDESLAWKISFPTPTTGYISVASYNSGVDDSPVLKTTDGGVTWSELTVPDYYAIQGVGFVSEQVGWVSGSEARETTDGGLSWHPVSVPDGRVNRFEFFGDSLGYAMGRRVYRYTRTTTATEAPPSPSVLTLAPAVPNPTAGATSLAIGLAAPATVRLTVVDVLGREVTVVEPGFLGAGAHRFSLDLSRLPTGVYVVRVEAGDAVGSVTITVAR